jgi:transposase
MATRETWAARVREWKRSGLTAAEFAERQGFNAATLTWWSSQLGRAALAVSRPPVVEVMVAPRADAGSSLEVMLASGIRVTVPGGFDEETLRRLLAVLEGR